MVTNSSRVSSVSFPESRSTITCGPNGGPDTEAGVAGGRHHPTVVGAVEKGAEARAGVDGARPGVGEADVFQLRERLDEETRQGHEGRPALLE